ncbi:MAG TPA: hypothetical protein VLE43_10965 [Candidatus Saccharimonadia bacterium]|nr:hypothetical protein [Candidatus Saccharimonadia bacterium]
MPTIELISIDCPEAPALPRYPSFACRTDPVLISRRGLFQPVFDSLNGVMVNVANKELEAVSNVSYAGTVVDWPCDDALLFRSESRDDVMDLMQRLLKASPQHRLAFATEYQFGGEQKECGEISISEFFNLHDRHALRYNTLWYVRSDRA